MEKGVKAGSLHFYRKSVINSDFCRYTADFDSMVFLDNHEPPFTEVVEQFKDVIQGAFKVDEVVKDKVDDWCAMFF